MYLVNFVGLEKYITHGLEDFKFNFKQMLDTIGRCKTASLFLIAGGTLELWPLVTIQSLLNIGFFVRPEPHLAYCLRDINLTWYKYSILQGNVALQLSTQNVN